MTTAGRRLLLVHAHPDDETIGTGATMARYAAEGAEVSLLTCTLGEFGEILVPELAELEWDKGDQLGGYRMGELAAALAALGVTQHFFLGGPGRFHDSGMIGTAGNAAPRAFWRAASDPGVFEAAVRFAVEVVRAVRPQVLVTYDPDGGYGHPDHVMAHRVATAAVARAGDPTYFAAGEPWAVAKFYWTATARSDLQRGLDVLRETGSSPFVRPERAEHFQFAVDDADITTTIEAGAHLAAKTAALRAHATQVSVAEPFFALSNHLGRLISGTERFRLVHGRLAGELDAEGRETDLFAGVG